MPEHRCQLSSDKKFSIRRDDEPGWYMRDEMNHSYVFGILFCPFCGEKLTP